MATLAKKIDRPLLTTRRLYLRPLRPRDSEAVYDAVDESRRRLKPWMPWVDATRGADDTLTFIRRMRRSPSDAVWGIWCEEEGALTYCGSVGLHRMSPSQGTGMLGYWIRRRCERRGYATEASAAAILWFFDGLRLERLEIAAATGNRPSRRVIEKLGFVPEGILRQAQRIPGRRRRLDWVLASLVRGDLARRRPRLRALSGTPRPWVLPRS